MTTTESPVENKTTETSATTVRVTVLPADPIESNSNWFRENPVLTSSIVFLMIIFGCVLYVKCGKRRSKNSFQNEIFHLENQNVSQIESRTEVISPSAHTLSSTADHVNVQGPTNPVLPEDKRKLEETSLPAPPSIGWTIPIGWAPSHGEPFRNVNDNESWGLAEFPRSSTNESVSVDPPPPYPGI